VAVTGLVGLPGSGKTLRLVQLVLEAAAAGRDVYANFLIGHREPGWLVPTCDAESCHLPGLERVHTTSQTLAGHPFGWTFRPGDEDLDYIGKWLGWRRGKGFVPDPEMHLLETWDDLIAIRVERDPFAKPHKLGCSMFSCPGCSTGITVAIDELNLWAPSRLWQELGIGVLNRWAYVRKDGLDIVWSAQHEARIDKVAREVTDHIWACRSFGGSFSLWSGRFPLHLQFFHRQKWIPALLTERNRTGADEGANRSGMLGLDFQTAVWGLYGGLHKVADRYDTYEHVQGSIDSNRSSTGSIVNLPKRSGRSAAGPKRKPA
jgi:hypothetical protein